MRLTIRVSLIAAVTVLSALALMGCNKEPEAASAPAGNGQPSAATTSSNPQDAMQNPNVPASMKEKMRNDLGGAQRR